MYAIRSYYVLMATHDPILALMASQRLVIKNGGIVITSYSIHYTKLYEYVWIFVFGIGMFLLFSCQQNEIDQGDTVTYSDSIYRNNFV